MDPAQIGGYDVVIADTQAPAVFGAKGEFFASGRLDNLSATHAGLAALIAHAGRAAAGPGAPIAVLAAFDHEEIGSDSRSGACGPILEDVLVRISDGLGASASQRRQALGGVVLRVRRRRATPCTRTTPSGTIPPTGRSSTAARC